MPMGKPRIFAGGGVEALRSRPWRRPVALQPILIHSLDTSRAVLLIHHPAAAGERGSQVVVAAVAPLSLDPWMGLMAQMN